MMSRRAHRCSALAIAAMLALTGCGTTERGRGDGGDPRDSAPPRDGETADDAGGGSDAGDDLDAGDDHDAGDGADAASGSDGGGGSDADVDVTFTGCSPDFSGDVVVVRNTESIAVSSTSGGSLTGSIQLDLEDERGTVELGTQHRVDTGAVINVVVDTTWTNIARDSSAVLSGEATDPIGGTLQIDTYDETAGLVDVTFHDATLQNTSDGSICTLDGRLQTFGLSY